MDRWPSLRWRLPLTISLVTVCAVAAVLFVAYRQVEATLIGAGEQRARAAAVQVAGLFGASVRTGASQLRSYAANPAVRDYLRNSTDANQQAARAALSALQRTNNWRVFTLWDATGRIRDEVVVPSAHEPRVPALPAASRPGGDEIRPLQPLEDRSFMEFTAPVVDAAPDALLGYLTLRTAYTISPPGLFSRLVGDDASILLGNRDGEFWIDLTTSRQAPAPRQSVGAHADISDTPFRVSTAFPREVILAPARAFLERMAYLGLGVVVLAAAMVRLLTRRVSGPLAELTAATEAVAAGDYSRPVPVSGRDELARLGRAFDAMRRRVADDIAERGEAARALRENEERLRYTLSAARVGTWEMDLQSGAMRWSETMGPLFGVEAGTLP
ncbi:MAG TPA: HAMP domain-containing protein, partial [Vicinamibacterales bacterium]|nr:HAMP domain-containing protein [Vicinamibacterales bacterium]